MKTIIRTIRYWKPHIMKYKWLGLATVLFFSGGTILSNTIVPLFYRKIINIVTTNTPATVFPKELLWVVGFMGITIIVAQLCYRVGEVAIIYFQSNVMRRIHNMSFWKITEHSYSYFSNNFTGGLVAKAKRLVNSFVVMHDTFTFNFMNTALVSLVSIIILFTASHALGAVLLGWIIIYIIATFIIIRKKMPYDLAEARADSRITGELADALTNVLNLKIFATKNREYAKYKEVTHDEYLHRNRAWHFQNLQFSIQGILMLIGEVGAMYVAVKLWLVGSVEAGTIVLVQIYFATIMYRVWDLGKALTRFAKSASDAAEMIDIFEIPIEIKDPKNPEPLAITDGAIVFKDVSFRYQDSVGVFKDFNLIIPAGQKVGLVGHSGSGKSTLTKVLLRFADVLSGSVTIDGQNIQNITQDDLRSKISFVPQEPLLFHRSIRENITYAKPDATEAEIIEVAKKAYAHDFISKLPQSYDTLVGERGVKLSGGERQRVAIARAMLKNAPIIMLDEATSSLDSVSESYIQEALEKLTENKTTIIIAHRLSTVQKMDRIIVLKNGEIVEDGTHAQLLKKKGEYHELWSHQSNGFIAD